MKRVVREQGFCFSFTFRQRPLNPHTYKATFKIKLLLSTSREEKPSFPDIASRFTRESELIGIIFFSMLPALILVQSSSPSLTVSHFQQLPSCLSFALANYLRNWKPFREEDQVTHLMYTAYILWFQTLPAFESPTCP